MYKHILVPTDGSKLSMKAAKEAVALARAVGARLTAIHVIPPYAPPVAAEGAAYAVYSPREYEKGMREAAEKALAKVAALASPADVRCDTMTVVNDAPWEAIIKAARGKKCDLVLMASHGRRGLAGLLLGSETTKVLTHSKVPVLVCR